MGYIPLVLFSFLLSFHALSAACCGGGASLPNLITGDFKSQITINFSNSAVTHSVDASGDFIPRDKSTQEVTETATLMGSYQFSQLWQIGASIPFRKNTYSTEDKTETTSGFSDLKIQLAYEFLPEYSYSRWKPRGFVFVQHTTTDGRSAYESQKSFGTDALGKGFESTSLGLSFFKIMNKLDFTFMGELHHSYDRTFNIDNKKIDVEPGQGYSFLFGAGISPYTGDFRYGLNIMRSHENSMKFSGDISTSSSVKDILELGLNLGYMYNDDSFIFSYADQGFFGYATNTTVAKSLSFSFVHFLSL